MKPKEIGCILFVVFFKCLSACTMTMCMAWCIEMDKLVLTCKVCNMEFTVLIKNRRTNSSCACYFNGCSAGGNLTIDESSNVTTMVFTVSRKSAINNDRWTCEHGMNRHQTSVDIIINQDNNSERENIQFTFCVELLFAALAGFVVPLILFFFVLVMIRVALKRELKIAHSTASYIAFAICGSMVFILPSIIGAFNNIKDCHLYGLMVIWGCLLAVPWLSMLFILNKETFNRDSSNNNGTPVTEEREPMALREA